MLGYQFVKVQETLNKKSGSLGRLKIHMNQVVMKIQEKIFNEILLEHHISVCCHHQSY